MPYINVKTNIPVAGESKEKIKSALGNAISDLPGKSESWLMVSIEAEQDLWFKGDKAPAAMVQVLKYGVGAQGTDKLTEDITSIINGETAIPADRIYVAYFGTPNWGWNGSNF
ncbi:MAG: hypothetical protein J6I96_06180 [Oscillospiraceae bacterium]|nr:hypothetical protein [Oscillospiraceae bacterium]